MTCDAYRRLLDRALNGEADESEMAALREHEAHCEDCAETHRQMDALQHELASLDDEVPPMPADFHQRWTALVEEEPMEQQKMNRFRQQFTRFLSVAAALVFVIGGTLMTREDLAPRSKNTRSSEPMAYVESMDNSGSVPLMMNRASGFAYEDAAEAEYDMVDLPDQNGGAMQPAKIIRTASLSMTTRNYDQTMTMLREGCVGCGGWVSYLSETTGSNGTRRASITLRIPAEQMDAYLAGTGDAGRVTSRSETSTDVSDSYYDMQTRLDTQIALMARLQAMVTDTADLTELLVLENQIAETQYTIDSLTGALQSTDRKVNFATVEISVREESTADPIVQPDATLGERIMSALETGWTAFTDFLADVIVFLMAALPFIAILTVAIVIVRIIRRSRKNK